MLHALMRLNNAKIYSAIWGCILINNIIIVNMYAQDIKNLFTRLIALSISRTQPVREWVVGEGSDY